MTAPWQELGAPAGLRRNPDGSTNDYAVRWDMDTAARGMNGYTSVTRRFAVEADARAAVDMGMGRAFKVTAFDALGMPMKSRRNPRHWRARRVGAR